MKELRIGTVNSGLLMLSAIICGVIGMLFLIKVEK